MNTFFGGMYLEPGQLVTSPANRQWGIGQIQSIDGNRITVNFENTGRLVLDGNFVPLQEYIEVARPNQTSGT